jgi:hypothetical protein
LGTAQPVRHLEKENEDPDLRSPLNSTQR